MRQEIERIQRLKHGVAIVFEMIFKPEYAVFEKVDMGTPEFGTEFAAALRKGRIVSVIHGHDQTVQQIELFAKLLDQQKEFGNDPPAMWHLPGKRKTYQLNRLNLEGYVFNIKDYGECRFELSSTQVGREWLKARFGKENVAPTEPVKARGVTIQLSNGRKSTLKSIGLVFPSTNSLQNHCRRDCRALLSNWTDRDQRGGETTRTDVETIEKLASYNVLLTFSNPVMVEGPADDQHGLEVPSSPRVAESEIR
ncbi:hypothetical protein LTR99_001319 [Exophiala xenobiotica]|uniref:Uncharacterized protein n=1 Tax=Vermiconidia calcicola TaxID=1690605 RepID=A0AAV9QL60_9PEZI|nr:hypothetical protein LTR99_001319 [Exophiala xenobiotica]KAK5545881.1 hypothetical protein LTR25_000891 [Vermiconidia calcicola]